MDPGNPEDNDEAAHQRALWRERYGDMVPEKIVDTKIGPDGRRYYKVQWASTTMEPGKNFLEAELLIKKYWDPVEKKLKLPSMEARNSNDETSGSSSSSQSDETSDDKITSSSQSDETSDGKTTSSSSQSDETSSDDKITSSSQSDETSDGKTTSSSSQSDETSDGKTTSEIEEQCANGANKSEVQDSDSVVNEVTSENQSENKTNESTCISNEVSNDSVSVTNLESNKEAGETLKRKRSIETGTFVEDCSSNDEVIKKKAKDES